MDEKLQVLVKQVLVKAFLTSTSNVLVNKYLLTSTCMVELLCYLIP